VQSLDFTLLTQLGLVSRHDVYPDKAAPLRKLVMRISFV